MRVPSNSKLQQPPQVVAPRTQQGREPPLGRRKPPWHQGDQGCSWRVGTCKSARSCLLPPLQDIAA